MEKAGGHGPKKPKDIVVFLNVYTVYIYTSKIDQLVSFSASGQNKNL